jgi:hypothetical protein
MIFGSVLAEEDSAKPPVWLQVSPVSTAPISLAPGAEYNGEFTVSNIGSEDFVFKVYASPFSVVGEDYDHDYSSEKFYNQIHRWVTFEKTEFNLTAAAAPDEAPPEQKVKFHISVPEDVPAGSQHAVLFAESSGSNANINSTGIKAISRVGMRLIAKVDGETHKAVEITQYSLPTIYISFNHSQIAATSKVKNTGNVDANATYHFEVKPFFGGDSVFTDDKTALIYTDSEFRHSIAWEDTPSLGLFSVSYSVTIDDITQDETHVVLVMPAWLLIIILALLTFLVVWITLKVKKRRKLRSKMQL